MKMRTFVLTAALVAAGITSTAAQTACFINATSDVCPISGQKCSEEMLCAKGLYCKAYSIGQDSKTFQGYCQVDPDIASVYSMACTLGQDVTQCGFNNPLALSPRHAPSSLRCVRAFETDTAGTCRIGPNKHGDACNQNAECASGNCLHELRMCKGIDEGEHCEPTFPDPCQPSHYCLPDKTGQLAGRCAKVVSPGNKCTYSEACERGFYCSGPDLSSRKCIPPFSVEDYTNTTVGPYMCKTANAVLLHAADNAAEDIYECRPVNVSRVGDICDPAKVAPPGYECKCSSTVPTVYRLRTLNALGIGGRSVVFRELFNCLNTATGIMGDLCEFDSIDLEIVRYGSCPYYQCYPQYLRLVNATGSRVFNAPLVQFENFTPCEISAAKQYYANVLSSECVTLPNLENWKCATDAGPLSLSVANTGGVIAFIFLSLLGLYTGHTYAYRKYNHQKLPFVQD